MARQLLEMVLRAPEGSLMRVTPPSRSCGESASQQRGIPRELLCIPYGTPLHNLAIRPCMQCNSTPNLE